MNLGAILGAAVLGAFMAQPIEVRSLAECDPMAVITVHRDDPTPCDLRGDNMLTITGLGYQECMDAGGIWLPVTVPTECVDADF